MNKRYWFAWALEGNVHQKPFLFGRYWWFGEPPIVPHQFEGSEICLFKTRQVARDYKKICGKGIVRKVKITVEWE